MPSEKKTYREIVEAFRINGYTVRLDALHGFMQKEKILVRDLAETKAYTESVVRKWLIQFLFKPAWKVAGITQSQLIVLIN